MKQNVEDIYIQSFLKSDDVIKKYSEILLLLSQLASKFIVNTIVYQSYVLPKQS